EDDAVRRRGPVLRRAARAGPGVAAIAAVLAARQPHLCRGSPDRAGRPRAGFHPRHARQPPGRRRSMGPRRTWLGMSAVLLGGAVAVVVAQQDMSKVEIKTEKLADDVWVLYGAGGNIGLCSGPDGALLIDDQFAPLSDKILAAVK